MHKLFSSIAARAVCCCVAQWSCNPVRLLSGGSHPLAEVETGCCLEDDMRLSDVLNCLLQGPLHGKTGGAAH